MYILQSSGEVETFHGVLLIGDSDPNVNFEKILVLDLREDWLQLIVPAMFPNRQDFSDVLEDKRVLMQQPDVVNTITSIRPQYFVYPHCISTFTFKHIQLRSHQAVVFKFSKH